MRFQPVRITRRKFLGAGAAAFADTGRSGFPDRIIDTHTHFYDPFRPQGVPWPSKDETVLWRRVLPDDFRKLTAGYGRIQTVVVEASPWLEDNQWLLDLGANSPLIVGVVGNLDPGRPGFADHLRRFARNPMFRGIRANGNVLTAREPDAAFRANLERLADVGLELDVLGGPDCFTALLRITDRLPELRIVLDHLPFGSYGGMLNEIASRPRIYAKVSGVLRPGSKATDLGSHRAELDELWRLFGPDRVLYGSNWPVSDLAAPYDAVFEVVRQFFAEKGQDALSKYFCKNALAAYRCA